MKKILIIASFLSFAAPAFSASFDCAKANTFVEKEICADPLLSALDSALAENFRGMMTANFGGTPKSLKVEQLKWLKTRNKCSSNKCLVDLYRKRVDETCEYGVVSGVHPECTLSEDIK